MSARATLAIAMRVLAQVRADHRTVALLLVVPSVLCALLRGVLDGRPEQFDLLGGPLLGIFSFLTMFLVTSITMLRERTSGTLERLMTLPLGRPDLLAGYALAFGALAAAQAIVTTVLAVTVLGLDLDAPLGLVGAAVAVAVLGTSLGLLASAVARTEFQAVQLLPVVVLPQFLLCGLLVPRADMLPAFEAAAAALPLTYAFDALGAVTTGSGDALGDVATIVGFAVAALALGAASLPRRTA